jgi:hypothetical protein
MVATVAQALWDDFNGRGPNSYVVPPKGQLAACVRAVGPEHSVILSAGYPKTGSAGLGLPRHLRVPRFIFAC